ncbi:AAA family ATPase [Spiroplasma endosymbiont of Amphibalanus improvisus]|uniref:AAA family ATPase n=1 Tax=Spiroplasma endosymbiont of Amphibalanus improvisus TaxID=3066327 RepID=UPI00313C0A2C
MVKTITNLAEILRPKTLSEIIGQSHLLNENGILKKMVEFNYVNSLIFYGPVGIGKTSLAKSLANDLKKTFFLFDASKDKKEMLTKFIQYAEQEEIIIIVDEVHRMNKTNQDFLLSFTEQKKITFFLCTTENPYFVINPALRSRSNILQLKKPTVKEMSDAIQNIILPKLNNQINITIPNIDFIAKKSNGDIRFVINTFELILNIYPDVLITKSILNKIIPNIDILNASYGDQHHDLKSALQKSVRASDCDAAIYYASAMLLSGDHEALLRRLVIMAHEDIGLSDPELCSRVIIACDSFRKIGFPEGRIILANIIIQMCKTSKSNSAYMALDRAIEHIKSNGLKNMPIYLKDNSYNSAEKLNGTSAYDYPFKDNYYHSKQSCMPPEIINTKFYKPNLDNNVEVKMNKKLKIINNQDKINNLDK